MLNDPNFNAIDTWARNYRAIREYASIMQPDRNFMTRLHIFWGKPDSGKSTEAFLEGAQPMFYDGRFYDYKVGTKKVVIEEMDHDSVPTRTLMLRMIDRFPFNIPVKGSFVKFVATDVYITTNFNPDTLFPYWNDPAFRRRIFEVKNYSYAYTKDEKEAYLRRQEAVLQETSVDEESRSRQDLVQEGTHA